MKHPIFHPDEEARIGPYITDKRLVDRCCVIRTILKPICGEYRYGVKTLSGIYAIVLESTLQKQFEAGDWGGAGGAMSEHLTEVRVIT